MHKAISVEADLCTGCRACELICSLVHEGECSPQLSRIRVESWSEISVNFPIVCQSCAEPVCVAVCPTKARKRVPETDAVITDERICVGCSSCIYACPYAAPVISQRTGKAMTCDLCGGDPQCVLFCNSGALTFETPERISLGKRRRFGDRFRG
ncbi:MAG TPA: 4Fe-4S dicluster domain-containing protein [Candidatus Latescibacteria bacterium]|nr:4Fe-4S dicluster domain-containing protein [Candidatus Latescibacterota bacterium]